MSKNKRNLKEVRKQFPIFSKKIDGCELTYLDSAATAQMPQSVIDTMVEYYSYYKSNVCRGVYGIAEQSTREFQIARHNIAQFIGAQNNEIIFTLNSTAGVNIVAQAWGMHNIQQGDEIIISEVEHHSNFVPWQQLAQIKKADLKIIPVNDKGVVDPITLKSYISSQTKLVALVHTSNLLGTTNDIKTLVKIAREVGARVLIDASQSIVHQYIDVNDIGCDFLVFSGHKLFGPTGIGVLYLNKNVFSECVVTTFGGGMIFEVGQDQTVFKEAPHCFEAGTQPVAQVLGLSAAIDFVRENINFDQLQQYETELVKLCVQELQQFEDITILSHIPEDNEHSSLVTFVSKKYHAHDLASYLDQYGIAVRAGNHCVQPYHKKLGINASVRVSFSIYNSKKDVELLIRCLRKIL